MMSEEIIIAIELICRRVTKVFFYFWVLLWDENNILWKVFAPARV